MTSTLRVLLVVLLVGTLTMSTTTTARASTTTVVSVTDPPRDAIIKKLKGLTMPEKRSIDIRRVTLRRVDNRARFVVKIRDVMRVPKFDQMFFVNWREHPSREGGPWSGQVGFTTKGRYSYASYSDATYENTNNCGVAVAIRPLRNEVVATVPWACVPEGPLRIGINAYTGHFRTDAPWFSRDWKAIPGWRTVLPD